ncbi:hypothetical protein [Cutibacterium phage PAVL34]|nr:hypothetical protein [Cutibacterium phage PAVL34]
MEDCDISVDAVCDLSTVAFGVVLDVADFEGDGGGVLVSGGVEEGAVAVVSVVGESHNCCFLYCLCWFVCWFLSGEAVSFAAERLGHVTVTSDGLLVLFEEVG